MSYAMSTAPGKVNVEQAKELLATLAKDLAKFINPNDFDNLFEHESNFKHTFTSFKNSLEEEEISWDFTVMGLSADNCIEVAEVIVSPQGSFLLSISLPSSQPLTIVATNPGAQIRIEVQLLFASTPITVLYDAFAVSPSGYRTQLIRADDLTIQKMLLRFSDKPQEAGRPPQDRVVRAHIYNWNKLTFEWFKDVSLSMTCAGAAAYIPFRDNMSEHDVEDKEIGIAFIGNTNTLTVERVIPTNSAKITFIGELIGSIWVLDKCGVVGRVLNHCTGMNIDKGFAVSGFTIIPEGHEISCSEWQHLNIMKVNRARDQVRAMKVGERLTNVRASILGSLGYLIPPIPGTNAAITCKALGPLGALYNIFSRNSDGTFRPIDLVQVDEAPRTDEEESDLAGHRFLSMTETSIQAIDLRQGTLTATFSFTKIVSTFVSRETFASVAGYDADSQHVSKRALITLKLTDDAGENKRVLEIGLAEGTSGITLRHATVNYITDEETSHEVFRWNSFEHSKLQVTRVFGDESSLVISLPRNFEVFLEDSHGMWSKVGRFGVVGVVHDTDQPPRLEVRRFRDSRTNRDLPGNFANLVLAGLSFISTGYKMSASTSDNAAWRFSPGTSVTETQLMGLFRSNVFADEYTEDKKSFHHRPLCPPSQTKPRPSHRIEQSIWVPNSRCAFHPVCSGWWHHLPSRMDAQLLPSGPILCHQR